jgi:LacI family transcriptional regulator
VAVVGYDDIPAAATFDPPLTTIRQPSKKLGQVAAQILFKLIVGETIAIREVVLPVEFIIRQSA